MVGVWIFHKNQWKQKPPPDPLGPACRQAGRRGRKMANKNPAWNSGRDSNSKPNSCYSNFFSLKYSAI